MLACHGRLRDWLSDSLIFRFKETVGVTARARAAARAAEEVCVPIVKVRRRR